MNTLQHSTSSIATKLIATCALLAGANASFAMQNAANGQCSASSGKLITPVLELYTSEGCSSCPPADQWVSGLKKPVQDGSLVVQAFHVGYWDYIGWVDRFATPAHTQRQRQIGDVNKLRSIYTPQLVLNGGDWRDWWDSRGKLPQPAAAAQANIELRSTSGPNSFEAQITPLQAGASWAAYWSVTENGHTSRVTAGENKGEQLKHDFVVRQYTPVGQYSGKQTLKFEALPAKTGFARQVNLVIYDPSNLRTLQALSVGC
jgi:hypothetical protein